MKQTNKEMVRDILTAMPREKKIQLHNACYRNYLLTSTYGLEFTTITIYNEGWYVEMEGTRCGFRIWVGDNDGEFVFGKRKPKESTLHKIWKDRGATSVDIGWLEDYTIKEEK